MKTLLIETATEKSLLLLADEGRVVASRFLTGGASLSQILALEVKSLVEAHSFKVERVVVGQGPGSYTGIRVGASLGQALAYGWGVPVHGIGSLEGFAPPKNGSFAVLVDARSGGFYTLIGERSGDRLDFQTPFRMKETDAKELLRGILHIASPHPNLIQNRLKLDSYSDKIWFETAPDPTLFSRLIFEKPSLPIELLYCASP